AGGRAPHMTGVVARPPFVRTRRAAPTVRCAMTDADLVAISLLPPRMWRLAADALREGDSPSRALTRLAVARWPDHASRLATLRADAQAALVRARTGGIVSVAWGGPAYPAALTTIIDPPAVIWARGCVEVLDAIAVAIVGSRAASPYALAVATQLAGDLA